MAKKVYESINPKEWKSLEGGKRFVNKETGEYISRRQYYNRSRGQSVESYAKQRKDTGQAQPRAARGTQTSDEAKEWANKRGATEKNFKTKNLDERLPATRTAAEHNKAIDKQRRDAINFKFKHGAIDERTRNSLLASAEREKMFRDRMQKIEDQLRSNKTPSGKELSRAKRIELNKEYDRLHAKFKESQKRLEKAGILPDQGDLKEGYYKS